MRAALIYPHQLFSEHPALVGADVCVLVEEPLLLTQYRFHRQKLILHRASMQHFADRLRRQKRQVRYVECGELKSTGDIAGVLWQQGVQHVQFVDPCDDWLQQRLTAALAAAGIDFAVLDDPHVLTPEPVFEEFAAGRKRLFFTDFYVLQRKRLGLLLDERGRPSGGKWSYDPENRKKLPRDVAIPPIAWPQPNALVRKARDYVRMQFPQAVGEGDAFHYPVTPEQARAALDDFLDQRFARFGEYEDAIHADETFLFHSVLTPALNVGLLSPRQVIDAALARADRVPLNSLEGFVRQIVGWREFMRGVYRRYGRRQRTRNFWRHRHADARRLLRRHDRHRTGGSRSSAACCATAYCHHIERLMILGNFMLLCDIDPDADLPVVHGVVHRRLRLGDGAQRLRHEPVRRRRLDDHEALHQRVELCPQDERLRKGPWCPIGTPCTGASSTGIARFFAGNPRMSVMVAQCDRMGSRLDEHLRTAEDFLSRLHGDS